eukprot:801674-Lingulodinium_polyedra.AAC.1
MPRLSGRPASSLTSPWSPLLPGRARAVAPAEAWRSCSRTHGALCGPGRWSPGVPWPSGLGTRSTQRTLASCRSTCPRMRNGRRWMH